MSNNILNERTVIDTRSTAVRLGSDSQPESTPDGVGEEGKVSAGICVYTCKERTLAQIWSGYGVRASKGKSTQFGSDPGGPRGTLL